MRTRALGVLFHVLRSHGGEFSRSTWRMIFSGVLLPMFDDVRHAVPAAVDANPDAAVNSPAPSPSPPASTTTATSATEPSPSPVIDTSASTRSSSPQARRSSSRRHSRSPSRLLARLRSASSPVGHVSSYVPNYYLLLFRFPHRVFPFSIADRPR